MLEKALMADILARAMSKGADFAELFFEDKQLSNVVCEDNRIESINSGKEKGAGIRVVKDGKTSYVYTNNISEQGLLQAAQVAAHAAGGSAQVKPRDLDADRQKAEFVLNFRRLPEEVGFAEKIAQVLAANQAARDIDTEIRQVTAVVSDMHKQVQIANSDGDLVEDELARVRMTVNVVASRNGSIQTAYEVAGSVSGWELMDQVSLADMARKAANRAVAMLSARPAPVGRMQVVMHADAGGTMVHEACGHGLEADLVQKGLSVYKDKLGEQVAAPQVTVIDDGTLTGRYGTSRFDDEGTPARRRTLIDKGMLVSYMYDRLTAQQDKTTSSGNGRRESYQHKPIPRMSNTFIASGEDDPDDIIRSTSHGLLVKKMGGGQVNTSNGDFVFDVQEGYIIEDGEIKYPVRGATLTGNGPKALLDIDRVGNDLGFSIGVCGKDGQGVPVSDAQPTIRIKQLTVGGTSMADHNKIRRITRK